MLNISLLPLLFCICLPSYTSLLSLGTNPCCGVNCLCVGSEWKLLQSSPFSERALRQEHKSLKYVLSQLLHHLKIVRLVPTRQITQLGGHKQKSKACISNAPVFVWFHEEPSAPSSTYVMVLEKSLLSLLPQINVTQPGKVPYVEGCVKGEDIS